MDATDGYRSREKGGTFQSLFLKGSRKDRERSTGQVDSKPQGWELCWRDPRYLSTFFDTLSCKSPPLQLQEFWSGALPPQLTKATLATLTCPLCPVPLARLCPVHGPS